MSLWAKAQQLPPETIKQIQSIYGDHFPIEVRHFLASWIEDKMWQDIDPDNPQHEQYAANLLQSLCQELELKAGTFNTEDLFLTKIKLLETAKIFHQRYSGNPLQLLNYVRQCLATELKLVQAAGGIADYAGMAPLPTPSIGVELLQQLDILRRRTSESAEDLKRLDQEHESFAIKYHNCTKLNATLQQMSSQPQNLDSINFEQKLKRQKEELEKTLHQQMTNLMQLRIALGDKLQESVRMLNQLQARVLDDELIRWKREQQLAGNGAAFDGNLDSIQEWCEGLAELIWLNRQQIREAERLKQKLSLDIPVDVLPQLDQQVTQLLSSLVTSTFIIEKQPPQVMKTNTRFTATVRLLVGGKLSVHMTPPQVRVTIVSEAQANALLKNDKLSAKAGDTSGEILNNIGTMEYQQATRQLAVSFRNMQLKKIKRAEKKGTESVMDEKFSLLFQSQFNVGGGELVFQVWTLSLPVVVIVHGNQEPHAWATVTWDNAFAEPGRIPFNVPDRAPWRSVADALSLKFRAATGRPLSEDDIRFLGEKAFRSAAFDNSSPLGWAQFCKEPLAERGFTFWEWFYAVMKLTREHLRGPWVDGAVMGFVRKKRAEEMLSSCPAGTFLLRFSDSELGGVTIAWVDNNSEVFMLQPFTSKDFAIRTLADRISDLQHLAYLYPDTSKDRAFGKYYTPFADNQPTSSNGYVKPLLVTHVPGWTMPGASYPNTPQHPFVQSPDPTRDTPSVASSYVGSVQQPSSVAGSAMMTDQTDQQDYFEQLDLKQLECFNELMQTYK